MSTGSLHYEFHFHHHDTSIWHLPTLPATPKQESLLDDHILITVVVVMAVAFHTHYHFKPPFKDLDKPIVSPACTFTWKELLAYGTLVHLTVRSQPARSEKAVQLYFLDWKLPPVLAKRLQITNHLVLGVYNPLHPQNSSLTHFATHAQCRFAIKDKGHPAPP